MKSISSSVKDTCFMADHSEQLGRIEGKLDIIIPKIEDNAKRIGKVEKKVYIFSGVLTTIVAIWGVINSSFK